MTPAEKAVIEAARNASDLDPGLAAAVAALDAECSTTPAESPRRWDQVVAEDEIYSTATSKWYRVTAADLSSTGKVVVRVDGVTKSFTVDGSAEVRCRRSETGKAVDVWVQVLSSS